MPNTIASTDVGGTGLSTVGTNGQVLTSNGTTLSWQTPAAATTFSAGTTGFTPNTATTGTVTLAGTLNVANGGTGLTSFTAGQIHYGSFSQSASLFWDSTNNALGIGTSSPSQRLTVSTSAGDTASFISSNSNMDIYLAASGTTLGNTRLRATGGDMAFITGLNERMRINSSGYVGIGTTSPETKLQIEGTADTVGATLRITSTGVCSAGMAVNATGLFFAADTGGFVWKTGAQNLPTTTGTERMRIDSSGNLKLSTAGTSIQNSSGRPMLNQTGGILAVYQATNNTVYQISGSGAFTNLAITLTPSSASSRFLLIMNIGQVGQSSGGSTVVFTFYRNATDLNYITGGGGGGNGMVGYVNADTNAGMTTGPTVTYIDSPATTSSITYYARYQCDGTKWVGRRGADNFFYASQQFQILEIAG
jgi:hypothetical protein